MSRALILLGKELRELGRTRGLLLSMWALPAPMVATALFLVYIVIHGHDSDLHQLAQYYRVDVTAGLKPGLIRFWTRECAGMFLLMPLFIPVLIASQSVAGEKERRTIEPLLASPLTAGEIVLAKSLSAVLPAMAITWLSYAVLAVGVDSLAHQRLVPDADFSFAAFVLAPLLCFFGNTVTVLISSRVSDARFAQQLSALVVIPFIGIVAVEFLGLVFVKPAFYAMAALIVAALDGALFMLAVKLFDRERILTRWG